jgi:hypothetical protein
MLLHSGLDPFTADRVREFPDDPSSLALYLGCRELQSEERRAREERQAGRQAGCQKSQTHERRNVMSTATSLENAGRMSIGWTVAVVGAGLMIAALIVGLLLQRGSDDAAVPSRVAVDDATVPDATADYGIRHLQKSTARSLDATADYGIRHMDKTLDSRSRTGGRELDASVDYGIRHAQPAASSLGPTADYGIRHPQRIVRPLAPEDDYGVRNRTAARP